jgi:hypothetical protein
MYLNNVMGELEIKNLQRTAILGTAYVLEKVRANVKLLNIEHGK